MLSEANSACPILKLPIPSRLQYLQPQPLTARQLKLVCRDAAGLLVAMARSSHADAEDQAPQEMQTDQHQNSSIHLEVQDQQQLHPQHLAAV